MQGFHTAHSWIRNGSFPPRVFWIPRTRKNSLSKRHMPWQTKLLSFGKRKIDSLILENHFSPIIIPENKNNRFSITWKTGKEKDFKTTTTLCNDCVGFKCIQMEEGRMQGMYWKYSFFECQECTTGWSVLLCTPAVKRQREELLGWSPLPDKDSTEKGRHSSLPPSAC